METVTIFTLYPDLSLLLAGIGISAVALGITLALISWLNI
jgi:hypothetical protein